MSWYYEKASQRLGPVPRTELDQLAQSGVIQPQTLVWTDGWANWRSYAEATAETASTESTAQVARCVECGGTFPRSDMIAYENTHVCAACKPRFFQKLQEGVGVGAMGLWRSKKLLVAHVNAAMPDRCVKCNEDVTGYRLKRQLYWHHPAVYLAILINLIIYAIIAIAVRKRATFQIAVCPVHRATRTRNIAIGWAAALTGIACFFAAGASTDAVGVWILAGIVLFLGGVLWGVIGGRVIYAKKITPDYAWIGGCGKEFLAELPEWSGQS
jgi:GYF domain 2